MEQENTNNMQQASKETTRKLASVQVINKIEELNKMKTLDIAHILGWNVLVKKNEFKPM